MTDIAFSNSQLMKFSNIFWKIVALVMAVGAVWAGMYLFDGAGMISYPMPDNPTEGYVLDGVMRVARGMTLYETAQQNPYVIHPYNPMTYLPVGLISGIIDAGPEQALYIGRVFSFFCSLALAIVLGRYVFANTGSKLACVIPALGMYLFHPMVNTEFYHLRPELPGMLCIFLCITIYLGENQNKLLWAGALGILAFMFKQVYIIAPIAIAIDLFIAGDRKKSILYAAIMGITVLCLVSYMLWLTDGGYYRNAIASMGANDLLFLGNFKVYSGEIILYIGGVVFALPLAVYVIARDVPKARYFLVYLPLLICWTLYTSSKYGAWPIYFNEFTITSLIMLALAIGTLCRSAKSSVNQFLLGGLLIAQILSVPIINQTLTPKLRPYAGREPLSNEKIAFYLKRFGALPRENVLIFDERLSVQMFPSWAYDWFLLEHLGQKHIVDLMPVVDKVRRGEYDRIIFSRNQSSSIFEPYIYKATVNGPYSVYYKDDYLVEWKSVK